MATSLQLTYTDLVTEVGTFLGFGPDSSTWQSEQVTQVDRIIQDGYRQFLYPQPLPNFGPINWTFLKPLGQLLTLAPFSGTETSSSSLTLTDSTLTLTVSSLIGATVEITDANGIKYTRKITANTADTLTWGSTGYNSGAITASLTGATYTVYQEDYDLPADFERLDGRLMFSPDDSRPWPIVVVDEQSIRRRREFPMSVSYAMTECAISRNIQVGSAAQRYQLMFWPRPDKVYRLNFRYEAVPPALSSTYPYPAGTASMSDVLLASCLAVAELRIYDEHGDHWKTFIEKLTAAAQKDRQVGPDIIGYNGNQMYGDDTLQYGVWNRLRVNGTLA